MANARMKRSTDKRTRIARTVRQVIDSYVEHKVADITASFTTATAGTVATVTQAIIEGDGVNERSGRQIRLLSSYMRFIIALPALNPAASVRVIYFQDTQALGAVPAVTDVLSTATVTSYYNTSNLQQNRFRVLYDKLFSMVAATHTAVIDTQKLFKIDKRLTYGASTSVAAANKQNALFVLVITDAVLNFPTFVSNHGLRFADA